MSNWYNRRQNRRRRYRNAWRKRYKTKRYVSKFNQRKRLISRRPTPSSRTFPYQTLWNIAGRAAKSGYHGSMALRNYYQKNPFQTVYHSYKALKSLTNKEIKFFDIPETQVSQGTTPFTDSIPYKSGNNRYYAHRILNAIPPGTSANTRVGYSIKVLSIHARVHTATDNAGNMVGIYIYVDYMNNGVDNLSQTTSDAAADKLFTDRHANMPYRNPYYTRNMKMLATENFHTGLDKEKDAIHKFDFPNVRIPVKYGTVNYPITGAIYIVFASSEGTSGSAPTVPDTTFLFNARIRYVDD